MGWAGYASAPKRMRQPARTNITDGGVMRRLLGVAAAMWLAGCGGDDPAGPGARTIPTGEYRYSVTAPNGTFGGFSDAGRLRITYAAPDSIAGTITPTGGSAVAFRQGGWNVDAYIPLAVMPRGLYLFRLARTDGPALDCEFRFVPNGSSTPRLGSCVVDYFGP